QLVSLGRTMPLSRCRPHGVKVSNNETSALREHSIHFTRVSLKVGQVTLVQVRDGKVEGAAGEVVHVLDVGNVVFVGSNRQRFRSLNHGCIQIEAEYIGSSPFGQHPAEPSLSTAAVKNVQPRDVPASLEYWRIQKARTHRVRSLSYLP